MCILTSIASTLKKAGDINLLVLKIFNTSCLKKKTHKTLNNLNSIRFLVPIF